MPTVAPAQDGGEQLYFSRVLYRGRGGGGVRSSALRRAAEMGRPARRCCRLGGVPCTRREIYVCALCYSMGIYGYSKFT